MLADESRSAPAEMGPRVVAGYDGSETAREAVIKAGRHAGPDGKVFVVHAFGLPPDFLGHHEYDGLVADRQAHGRARLDAVLYAEGLPDSSYEAELIGGPPAVAIKDVARTRDADEIVVGSRGLNPVRAVLGSVSHELLRPADRPVVVIPGKGAVRR